jgi:hypothetical protein
MAGALEKAQHHDRDEVTDMQAVRRAVISYIGGNDSLGGQFVQTFHIRALMDEAARRKGTQKFRTEIAHHAVPGFDARFSQGASVSIKGGTEPAGLAALHGAVGNRRLCGSSIIFHQQRR